MKFYQTEKRQQSQAFSADQFNLQLSELLLGCVPSLDNFLKDFLQTTFFENSGDNITAVKNGNGKDKDEVIDYLIDISTASYILWDLFLKTKDPDLSNNIDRKIGELSDAVGPRTGEHIIKNY